MFDPGSDTVKDKDDSACRDFKGRCRYGELIALEARTQGNHCGTCWVSNAYAYNYVLRGTTCVRGYVKPPVGAFFQCRQPTHTHAPRGSIVRPD